MCGVYHPEQQSLTIEDRSGRGVSAPAVHRTEGSFGEPFCGMSLKLQDLTNTPLVGFYTFHVSLPFLPLLGIISQINYPQVLVSSSNFGGIQKQLLQFRKQRMASKTSDFPLLLKHQRPGNPESRFPMATISWSRGVLLIKMR